MNEKSKLSYIINEGMGISNCKTCFLDQTIFPMTVPEICVKAGEETINGVACEIWKGYWAATDMQFWVSKTATPYIARSWFDFNQGSLQITWDFSNVQPIKPGDGVWQPNCSCSAPVCEVNLDLTLLLDGSGSINDNDFLLMKNFAVRVSFFSLFTFLLFSFIHSITILHQTKIVNQFAISDTAVHVSVIQFSGSAMIQIPLSGDKNAITTAIRNINQAKGSTNMDAGLKATYDMLTGSRSRSDANKAVVMFTDGVPDSGTNPVAVAQTLKEKSIDIYTVGVGSGVDPTLLKKIASEPVETHTFLADSFVKLQSLLNSLLQATCKGDTCASSS